jgi:arylsulfatase A-like enzyme
MIPYKKIFISTFLIFILSICLWFTLSFQTKAPHGIILISLDTLRADHLGTYGYRRNTSPSIDAFAKESVVFENAVVQAPNTLPSHMSIMTSLYPSSHEVGRQSFPLADEHLTLAELLGEGGYQTAAFTDGGFVSKIFGFDHGFDIYDDQGGGFTNILPKVKKWLDMNKAKPFFLFIHSYDIHSPYNPPLPYNSMFHNFPYAGSHIPSNQTLGLANKNELNLNNEDLSHFIALYDGGIRYTDEKIGEFLSYLKDSGLAKQSLIIITSDHGEAFKEHGRLLHRQLYYRPNLHVPLIIRIPKYPKKEIRIKNLVRSIDLLPTILDITALPTHPKAQGESLLPLIKRQRSYVNQFLWKISHPFAKDLKTSLAESEPRMPPHHRSIITNDGYQMITDQTFNYVKLFNLNTDPLAKNDIAKDRDDITEQLLLKLKRIYSMQSYNTTSIIHLDEQTHKQLEALGYIDSTERTPNHEGDSDRDDILKGENNRRVEGAAYQKDTDGDGIPDNKDNCPLDYNPNQEDVDEDNLGDACDNCIDSDWDGYGNPEFPDNNCTLDNCPSIFNPGQEDGDGDGIGSDCDNCPNADNLSQEDLDQDGIGDVCDICPDDYNPDQSDYDKDGIGDVCDECTDTDRDGYGNPGFSNTCLEDNCSYVFNPGQEDEDGNGIGDTCESEFEDHWLEVEHAQSIVKPLEVADDEDASKGKYIYAPNGTVDQYTPGPTMAIYMVNISQAGEYVLWGNVSAADKGDNSFFVQVDNGLDNSWEVEPGISWHWDVVNNRHESDPVKFILTEGLHKIKVKLREDGTKLDKLLLTNNMGFVPRGKGDHAEN